MINCRAGSLNARAINMEHKALRFAVELLDTSPDALLVVNDAGTIILSNDRAQTLFGYSGDELAARKIEELIPVRLRKKHRKHRAHYARHRYRRTAGQHLGVDLFGLRRDGSEFPAEIALSYLDTEDGPLTISSVRDVSHRLLEEKQYKDLLDASPDAMVVAASDGSILLVNDQTLNLFGYAREELVGSSVEMLLPERFRESHRAHRARFKSSPTRRPMGTGMPLYGLRKDGKEFPIEISLSPVDTSQGQIVSSSIRDVTAHIEAANELTLARETAEKATGAKSRFLAAANHDLRQPLQSLGLYLSVLMRRNEQQELEEIGTKMQRSLDTMAELMDALLDISKLESGGISPKLANTPIDALMQRIIDNNIQQAEKKHLAFDYRSSAAVVRTDPVLLERVIQNFVTNAIRYTDSGFIRIECKERQHGLRISVHDSGIGIPEAEVDNIFNEYYQLDNPMRDRRKGLGLGLAIVKHIAELLDHPLDVRSTPGVGSEFSIQVPYGHVQPSRDQSVSESTSVSKLTQPFVLFVDDDTTIIDATAMLLESANIHVTTASNAEAAVGHVRNGLRPDIVVTDFRLPGLSGVELIDEVRTLMQATVPAIVISGDTSTASAQAKSMPQCAVLSKPVDTERLISLIHQSSRKPPE